MSHYTATVHWQRGADEPFTDNRYSRGHQWSFDGGVTFRASASPHVVGKFADPAGVDPEEAFVASLSSCHMLTFLHLAAKAGRKVDSYADTAEGRMTKTDGRVWVAHPAAQGLNFVKAEKGPAIVALSLSPAVDKVAWADEDGAAGVIIL